MKCVCLHRITWYKSTMRSGCSAFPKVVHANVNVSDFSLLINCCTCRGLMRIVAGSESLLNVINSLGVCHQNWNVCCRGYKKFDLYLRLHSHFAIWSRITVILPAIPNCIASTAQRMTHVLVPLSFKNYAKFVAQKGAGASFWATNMHRAVHSGEWAGPMRHANKCTNRSLKIMLIPATWYVNGTLVQTSGKISEPSRNIP